jgi:hypothetical protein
VRDERLRNFEFSAGDAAAGAAAEPAAAAGHGPPRTPAALALALAHTRVGSDVCVCASSELVQSPLCASLKPTAPAPRPVCDDLHGLVRRNLAVTRNILIIDSI